MLAAAKTGSFSYEKWKFDVSESHILKSDGPERER